MLDFRRNSHTPNYLGAGQQRRLLVFVGVAALLAFVVFRYGGLRGNGPAEDAPLDKNRRAVLVAQAEDESDESDEAPTGPAERALFPGVRADYLAKVEDDTVFRAEEADAWFHLLALLEQTPQRELQQESEGRVGFLQLDQQAETYRGRLVSIEGVARSAKLVEAPDNGFGIARYYQLWVQPQRMSPELVVVYALELPGGFPLGASLDAECAVTGFFFKRWAYQSRGGIRTAPLLLARSIDWQPPPAPPPAAPLGNQMVWALAAAGTLAVLILGFVIGRTRATRRRNTWDADGQARRGTSWEFAEPADHALGPRESIDSRRGGEEGP